MPTRLVTLYCVPRFRMSMLETAVPMYRSTCGSGAVDLDHLYGATATSSESILQLDCYLTIASMLAHQGTKYGLHWLRSCPGMACKHPWCLQLRTCLPCRHHSWRRQSQACTLCMVASEQRQVFGWWTLHYTCMCASLVGGSLRVPLAGTTQPACEQACTDTPSATQVNASISPWQLPCRQAKQNILTTAVLYK